MILATAPPTTSQRLPLFLWPQPAGLGGPQPGVGGLAALKVERLPPCQQSVSLWRSYGATPAWLHEPQCTAALPLRPGRGEGSRSLSGPTSPPVHGGAPSRACSPMALPGLGPIHVGLCPLPVPPVGSSLDRSSVRVVTGLWPGLVGVGWQHWALRGGVPMLGP